MPLTGPLEILAVVTLFLLYSMLKLVKWSLNAEVEHVRQEHVNYTYGIYKLFLLAWVLVVFGSPIARWAGDVWHLLAGLVP